MKRREAKSKDEKERYKYLNAEFQRIASIDKKAFFSDQCKEIEENNRMGKTRDLFMNIRDIKGTVHAKMGTIKDRICHRHTYIPSLLKLPPISPPKYTKINSKWIKDLNVRPETIKLLEENVGRTLDDINQSRIHCDPPPRVTERKTKVSKGDLIILTSFFFLFFLAQQMKL